MSLSGTSGRPAWLPLQSQSRVDQDPLLPTHEFSPSVENEEDYEIERFSEKKESWRQRLWRYKWYSLVVPLSLLALVLLGSRRASKPSQPEREKPPHPTTLPNLAASPHTKIDLLLSSQSSTLAQATSRYRLRNGREPPPNFSQWFDYAREHSCLIDEYHQIAQDFEPFYQLAKEDPEYFKRMLSKASDIVHANGLGMTTGAFENGAFKYTDFHGVMYTNSWPRTFGRLAPFMPNMSLVLNSRDEPRVLFNHRKILPDMKHQALVETDPHPFHHSPTPTDQYFRDEMGCLIPNAPKGFTDPGNNSSAFMLYSSSTEFTTSLYPVLSVTKISPCFSDLVVPSEFYYSDSEFAAFYAYKDNVDWRKKEEKLYWRGSSTGGHIYNDNYHHFPRFKLVDISRTERGGPLMDVALSAFHDYLCGAGCDARVLMEKYGAVRAGTEVKRPREEVYKYKYLMDVDGNSFSGRYIGLLKSGSLVFKSTVFTEFFSQWLVPFEHYIPVLPDLSDLLDKIEWAKNNDAEARAIQKAGKEFAERVLTDGQMDCYFALAMLEWGRLQAMAEAAEEARVKTDKGKSKGEGEALD
ncbi:CAP10 domain-containing protein [Mycena indigotica]|uniref:CAP10 domain-containing protein n=1 Tax=Mycena indigotica TaxID=2126181 RepID=A0A8H6SW54_9AGAR|nr:CAP10 domain-containing protein [Mycena indigotica]KAF7306225.1 CAP10 domain-containing protein [Mycena indigotica]